MTDRLIVSKRTNRPENQLELEINHNNNNNNNLTDNIILMWTK
jgi:hypothetical protein